MSMWTALPEHDWPGGEYVGATCLVCGVKGFNHHKYGPRLCWPHAQAAKRDAEWRDAELNAEMVAEYGPRTAKEAGR